MQTMMERERESTARDRESGPFRVYGRRLARLRKDVLDEAQDRLHAARRGLHETRRNAEDRRDAMALGIRRHPFRAVSLAFAVGGLVAIAVAGISRHLPGKSSRPFG
jgi:hypothetical protein